MSSKNARRQVFNIERIDHSVCWGPKNGFGAALSRVVLEINFNKVKRWSSSPGSAGAAAATPIQKTGGSFSEAFGPHLFRYFLELGIDEALNALHPVFRRYTHKDEQISEIKRKIYSICGDAKREIIRERPEEAVITINMQIVKTVICDEDELPRIGRSAFEGLKTIKFQDTCAICWDKFLQGTDVTPMPCSHMFHDECLGNWLKKKNNCPLCRASVLQVV